MSLNVKDGQPTVRQTLLYQIEQVKEEKYALEEEYSSLTITHGLEEKIQAQLSKKRTEKTQAPTTKDQWRISWEILFLLVKLRAFSDLRAQIVEKLRRHDKLLKSLFQTQSVEEATEARDKVIIEKIRIQEEVRVLENGDEQTLSLAALTQRVTRASQELTDTEGKIDPKVKNIRAALKDPDLKPPERKKLREELKEALAPLSGIKERYQMIYQQLKDRKITISKRWHRIQILNRQIIQLGALLDQKGFTPESEEKRSSEQQKEI